MYMYCFEQLIVPNHSDTNSYRFTTTLPNNFYDMFVEFTYVTHNLLI